LIIAVKGLPQSIASIAASSSVFWRTISAIFRKMQELVREVEAGGKAIAFKADSDSAEELQNVVNHTVAEVGSLDIFVSNTGILKIALLDQFTLEGFDQMLAVNVRAASLIRNCFMAHDSQTTEELGVQRDDAHREIDSTPDQESRGNRDGNRPSPKPDFEPFSGTQRVTIRSLPQRPAGRYARGRFPQIRQRLSSAPATYD